MAEGRLTLPIETGIDEQILQAIERFKADAVRNSDGTELPELVKDLATKVYSTYFPARGHQEWALAHPDSWVHQFLMSAPRTALVDGPLEIDPLAGYFTHQFQPETACDLNKYWQVIDRTTGETLTGEQWQLVVEDQNGQTDLASPPLANSVASQKTKYPAAPARCTSRPASATLTETRVIIPEAKIGHEYTVDFLAKQIWDSTQMYNYITNDWQDDPARSKDLPYDVRREEVWAHMQEALDEWLVEHPEVDVVRFTTFFYHFTIVYDYAGREKFIEWFGYSASVSPEALEAFAAQYGYELTPEDFVDQGFYNNAFRSPTRRFLDWMDFQSAFVASRAAQMVEKTHKAGKEAMMFLGDNWIGMEPYGPHFPSIKLDAVVGSVGSAATCRMISDIPGVKYTEGRFLPYFFPDVFNDEGDPVGEANESWRSARRAIMRKPLDRIGYGGYLSLALKYPAFTNRMEEIITEFRAIHAGSAGQPPANAPIRVAILNAWGKRRSWMTHMVTHAQYYRQTHPWIGVLESLAGLPFDLQFLSFTEVMEDEKILDNFQVIINVGAADTAFSGGPAWKNPALLTAIRAWVARGGGLIGVGQPTALRQSQNGASTRFFQLADIFGVDEELGDGLSQRRPQTRLADSEKHFILDGAPVAPGGQTRLLPNIVAENTRNVYAVDEGTLVLAGSQSGIDLAVNTYGRGRAVYYSGLPFDDTNAASLYRAILWAAGLENNLGNPDDPLAYSSDPRVEVATYPQGENQGEQSGPREKTEKTGAKICAYNNSDETLTVHITGAGINQKLTLTGLAAVWLNPNANNGGEEATRN